MKSISAYYLLFFYTIAMCKPVLPVAKDMLAHIFWNNQHILTTHHENGKDHLHYELIDAESEKDSENKTPLKFSEPVSAHIIFQNPAEFCPISSVNTAYPPRIYLLLNRTVELNIPPPKA